MSVTALRKELCGYIHSIPEFRLEILRPLLADYAEHDFLIETDLTDEELVVIAEGRKLFREHPEEFESLADFLEHTGVTKKRDDGNGEVIL
jgi:hypothetical protein